MKILFIIPCGNEIACGAVRVQQYLRYLPENGISYDVVNYIHPLFIHLQKLELKIRDRKRLTRRICCLVIRRFREIFGRLYNRYIERSLVARCGDYDLLFFQRVLLGEETIKAIKGRYGRRLVFDFDDAIFLEEPEKAAAMIAAASQIVVGSHYLLEYCKASRDEVVLVPSSVPIDRYRKINCFPRPKDATLCIGWIGGNSTIKYLSLVFGALEQLVREGHRIKLLIAGTWNYRDDIRDVPGLEIVEIAHYSSGDIPGLVEMIDIGLMPLYDTPWERGKCAMKALLYMAGGVPVVSSPVGEVNFIVEDGVNGFLANTPGEWKAKLEALIENPLLRKEFGEKGRALVEERYSTPVCFEKLYSQVLLDDDRKHSDGSRGMQA